MNASETHWVPVEGDFELQPGDMKRSHVNGLGPVLVANVEGELLVASDLCPHAGISLSSGFLEEEWIVCPAHMAEFNLRTGTVRHAPPGCGALTLLKAKYEDRRLSVALATPRALEP